MQQAFDFNDPKSHILRYRPDLAMAYFCPASLQKQARRFQAGFGGLVSYAVKANAGEGVLTNLVAAGLRAFDVASPVEMQAVRAVCPDAVLHYHNPVRSPEEVAFAAAMGVTSYSVDCARELAKLADLPAGTEIAVRLALPVSGGAYDFGEKFGLAPKPAVDLLRAVAGRGFTSSLTFHPGTQCALSGGLGLLHKGGGAGGTPGGCRAGAAQCRGRIRGASWRYGAESCGGLRSHPH